MDFITEPNSCLIIMFYTMSFYHELSMSYTLPIWSYTKASFIFKNILCNWIWTLNKKSLNNLYSIVSKLRLFIFYFYNHCASITKMSTKCYHWKTFYRYISKSISSLGISFKFLKCLLNNWEYMVILIMPTKIKAAPHFYI